MSTHLISVQAGEAGPTTTGAPNLWNLCNLWMTLRGGGYEPLQRAISAFH